MSRSIPTEDRISALPDPIIYHILSFLPTKLAAITSVLSKRWKPLWLSVSILHFDDKSFPNFISFRHFVSSVFLSRDITLPLRSFHLKSGKASSRRQHDINRFLQAAAQRGIVNFKLEMISFKYRFKLHPSIFSCRTLVVLHLEGLKVNDLSHVLVDFPLLKTLYLCNVHFEGVQCLLKFLSGCPILEELQIRHLHPKESRVLEEKFQCLPNLIRAEIDHLSFKANALFTLLCRVEFLRVQFFNTQLDTGYIDFPTFQNLTHMELILYCCEEWQWVIEVLKSCPKLQNLIIDEDIESEDEVVGNWMDPSIIPECLSTQFITCSLEGFKCMEFGLQFAKYIMQNSKVLNILSIKSDSSVDKNAKYQMLMKSASWTRASTTCKLLFE